MGKGGCEITSPAVQVGDFRQSDKFNIDVPADLDQFRRNNSHGAVIGGKCLVQLGHHTADGRRSVDKIYIKTRIRKVNGCLHSADSTPYYKYRTYVVLRHVTSPIISFLKLIIW